MKNLLESVLVAAFIITGCQETQPPANESPIVIGDIPIGNPQTGCGSTGLVNQNMAVQELTTEIVSFNDLPAPSSEYLGYTFVLVTARNCEYTAAYRIVDPITCTPVTTALLPVRFDIDYIGAFDEFHSSDCMNTSSLVLTEFSISGTVADNLIEEAAKQEIWRTMDSLASARVLLDAPGRCGNWSVLNRGSVGY